MTPPAAKTEAETSKKTTAKKKAAKKEPKEGSTAAIARVTQKLIYDFTKQRPASTEAKALPFVSSGSAQLDHMIGGTLTVGGRPKCPGYPRRRVTEIYGPEASGKTTLALHAIAEAQRDGGIGMFLDFEHALDHEYARAVGVNYRKDKFLYYQPENMEQGFKMMYAGIAMGVDIVVLDSIAALVSEKELKKDMDKEARIGERARQMSNFLPKLVMWLSSDKYSKNKKGTAAIFINQARDIIGQSKGSGETTPGGKALKYFAYLRLRSWRMGSEMVEVVDKFTGKKQDFPYGNKTRVKVVKTKIDAKEGFTADIFIRFGKGIDDYYSIIEGGVTTGVIKKGGAWYSYEEHKFQGRDKFRTFLVENPKVFEDAKSKVLSAIRSDKNEPIPEPNGDEAVLKSMEAEFGAPPEDDGDDEPFDPNVGDDDITAEDLQVGD